MNILLITGPFNADVSGIPTTKTEAKLGALMWTDRTYRISTINDELVGATFFKPEHYVDKATISVTANHNADVFVAVHEPRDGGLIQGLQTSGWELTNYSIAPRLNKVLKKQISAGSTVLFTSTEDNMTFAILVKKGS